MSFSVWCPSFTLNASPVTFALMAAVGSLLCFALLFLAVFCLVELHSTALWCKQQFCFQLSDRLLLKSGKKELQILPACTSYFWCTHCEHTALILSSFVCLAGPSQWKPNGRGWLWRFLHALFSSCGHRLRSMAGGHRQNSLDDAGQSCAADCILQCLPSFYCMVSPTYATQCTHTMLRDPEKEKIGTLH